ncbi:hypothetical protein QBC34DRAFT_422951 [Podospora aff. communis PSN243]|uniref:Uncharacterized protein n=1 Tax=Podospora aff. communis PSN243 TaxID=3040156 RepID=A0AAV9GX06_9PEZI|nr:hypothetical protein QBC34DRAFT_422951 [Podospora aff. communis PSN243]
MSSMVTRTVGELTVGHVAGIIAAGVVVVRFLCPAILTYVLAGLLRDTETASTWTVANVGLQASIWPTILRTDSTSSGGTARTLIRVTCKALPLMALLTAIAGIVTPLGLGETLVAGSAQQATFEYIQDESAYGQGTSLRGQNAPSRICIGEHQGRQAPVGVCPGSNAELVFIDRPDGGGYTIDIPKGYNTSVPVETREIFSSGTGDSTVSNFFDIEYRQLSTDINPNLGDTRFSVGMFRTLDSSILDNRYKVVEGLVVDAVHGGVGFRNHTVPVGLSRGAVWEEDLLFIEPATACVNTNLTLDFNIVVEKNVTTNNIENLFLTDRGGFSQMNTTLPPLLVLDGQTNPELQQRAYQAAWLNNAFTMLYLNVTNEKDKPRQGMKSFSYMNSEIDKGFSMPHHSTDDYEYLSLENVFGSYLHLGGSRSGLKGGSNYSNPFNISETEFDSINDVCAGTVRANRVNLTNIYVGCGLLRGAPKRVDGGSSLVFESGSKWSSSLHACASSVRATIKRVQFRYNSTNVVGLEVLAITPKLYATEADAPLWGLEDSGNRLDSFNPIWGLISPEYATRKNVTTVRKADFNLIGTSDPRGSDPMEFGSGQNLAGADFAQKSMNSVYRSVAQGGDWPVDLRGAASMAVFRRWQNMSADAATAGRIIDLMWTDVATSAVVGTRGVLGEVNSGTKPAGEILVHPITNRITYDVRYAIPAAILIVWMGVIFLVALLCTCCCGGRAGFKTLRRRIEQLSVGRVMTTFLYPQESTLTMPAKQWRPSNGLKTITVDVVARRAGEEVSYSRSGEGGETYGLIGRQKR